MIDAYYKFERLPDDVRKVHGIRSKHSGLIDYSDLIEIFPEIESWRSLMSEVIHEVGNASWICSEEAGTGGL